MAALILVLALLGKLLFNGIVYLLLSFCGLVPLILGFVFFKKHKILSIFSFVIVIALNLPLFFYIRSIAKANVIPKEEYIEKYGELNYELSKDNDDKVIELIESKTCFLDLPNDSDYTPLMVACKKDKKNIAKKLLEYGANPDKETWKGDQPIFYCVDTNDIELLKILIKHKAYLNVQNCYRENPLVYIIKKQDLNDEKVIAKIKLLSASGCNPEEKDENGKDALDYLEEKNLFSLETQVSENYFNYLNSY